MNSSGVSLDPHVASTEKKTDRRSEYNQFAMLAGKFYVKDQGLSKTL